MKGIFNKLKSLKSSESQNSSPSKKTPTKQIEVASEEAGQEEGQKATKKSFFPSKKIAPKTRHQLVKEYLNSAKFYKLLQALEKEGENDHEGSTSHNVYFKENFKPMGSVLKEKLQTFEEVNLASKEIASLYNSYQNGGIKDETPLFCISVINLPTHAANEAATLEYVYPDFKDKLRLDDEIITFLNKSLKHLGVPDASKNEDIVYFIIDVNRKKFEKLETESLQKLSKDISNDHAILYGISFCKQIPVAETGTVQKAVCILSRVPLFGHILAKLDPVTKCYLLQESHTDYQILTNFYDNINSSLKEITINLNELLAGTCTKKLVYFLKAKLMTLWKALFLEKRVLVVSQSPGACSTFIHSLLALYPCLCHFKYHSKALSSIENHYSEYGLPLRFFHEDCPLVPYLKADDAESIGSARGFLAGTSKALNNVSWDILVDIDKNSIQFKNDAVKKAVSLTKQDKEFIQDIIKKVTSNNSAESLSWSNIESSIFNDVDLGLKGSEEWIRHKFYDYLKNFLTELEFFAYGASAEKLDSHIDDFNAYLTNKGQTDENFVVDWKDEILSPEDETGSRKDCGDETEDEEIGSPMSGRSRSSKGKRVPNVMSQDDLDDLDTEEKKAGEEKEAVKERRSWFRSPLKRDSKQPQQPSDVKSPQDVKDVLKKELLPLKDSLKVLKKYGIDWMLAWARTSNFECWVDAHMRIIRERSQNYRWAKNHVWCMENGDIYVGDLRFGQKTGTGQLIDRQAKMVYIGDWEEDERNGTGKLISLENGETIYEGNFSGNKRHGAGKSMQNKEKYTGAYNMEKYEGHGTLVDKDNNTYEGEFKEGFKWGIGKLQLVNGDFYTGEFVKDKYHGKGQLVCKNGDFYSGEFREGMKWGRGILQKASGETYEGQFLGDLYEGHGKLTLKDGHAFEGAFFGGHFSSSERGFIHYPDGSEYMGEINDYKAHGYGTMTKFEGNQEIVCYGIYDSDQLIEEISKVVVDQKGTNNEQKVEGEEPK